MNKHATSEELAEYLYDEMPAEKRDSVARHLDACPDCRGEIEAWRGARQTLAAWQLPRRQIAAEARPKPLRTAIRWAVAAMLMLAIGYGTGRLSRPASPDLAALRTEVAQQLRGEMRGEIQGEIARFVADQSVQQRHEYQRALVQAANQLEARQAAEYASLRQDVETVAFRTQQGFESLTAGPTATPAVYETPLKSPRQRNKP